MRKIPIASGRVGGLFRWVSALGALTFHGPFKEDLAAAAGEHAVVAARSLVRAHQADLVDRRARLLPRGRRAAGRVGPEDRERQEAGTEGYPFGWTRGQNNKRQKSTIESGGCPHRTE